VCGNAYTARSRVCVNHLQAFSVDIDGEGRRFCQKCTRFHPLDLFEGTHRTCTEQLIKRQLTPKRPRKLNMDGSPKTPAAAATTQPADASQGIPSRWGLYKLNAAAADCLPVVYPVLNPGDPYSLKAAWFQPLSLS
jgi:hypothetical protein